MRLLEALGRDSEAAGVLDRYWRKQPRDPESLVEGIRFASRAGQQGRVDQAIRRLGEIPGHRALVVVELAAIRASREGAAAGLALIQKSKLDLTRPINGPALQALLE